MSAPHAIRIAPFRNRKGRLCSLCDSTDEHEHPEVKCSRCGRKGLEENWPFNCCIDGGDEVSDLQDKYDGDVHARLYEANRQLDVARAEVDRLKKEREQRHAECEKHQDYWRKRGDLYKAERDGARVEAAKHKQQRDVSRAELKLLLDILQGWIDAGGSDAGDILAEWRRKNGEYASIERKGK